MKDLVKAIVEGRSAEASTLLGGRMVDILKEKLVEAKKIVATRYGLQDYLGEDAAAELNELSKKTLGSYIKKAADDVSLHSFKAGRGPSYVSPKDRGKIFNRLDSIGKATDKLAKEELDEEPLDELSKTTLGSYIKKATNDVSYHSFAAGDEQKGRGKNSLKHDQKSMQRQAGVEKATDKIVKEEPLDEGDGPFDMGHVVINKPGNRHHGKVVPVFHRHDDGRVNVQVRTAFGGKTINNYTLHPGEHTPFEKKVNEEFLDEGRPSQRHPLEGHEYHKKTDASLTYIAKDAHAAAEAMKGGNTAAENKYRDQVNDSDTVRHWRQKNGMPDWYKKKYGHIKEETLDEAVQRSGRLNIIKARIRKGKVQRRKKVSAVAGYTLRGGKLTRMTPTERRKRRLGQRRGKIKRRRQMSRTLIKRKRSLVKRKAMGIK